MQSLFPMSLILSDPVQYLLSRKFPDHAQVRLPSSLSGGSPSLEERAERLKEIDGYEAELRAMPHAELLALRGRERAQERLEVERDDVQRFFHQPQAAADFAHWSKAAHWTLVEAVALSFGKAPEVVNWQSVRPFIAVSPFAVSYQRRRDLACGRHTGNSCSTRCYRASSWRGRSATTSKPPRRSKSW